MEFLIEYRLLGLFIGVCTFLIIGLFHPVVVKAEYYWGTRCWWVFLLLGLGGMAVSLLTDNVLLAALAGVFAFSSLWTIKELFEQREPGWPRVGFPPIRKGRERNRKRRGRYGDACLWLSLFATGIVGCKRLSSPACEGIVLSGRMDSAARGFRSLAGGSGRVATHGSERFLGKVALSARLKVFLLSVPVDQCRREMFLERSCCISRVGSVGRRRCSDLAVSKDMPE